MYKVLYRRWRPTRFDKIVGQEHISLTLKNQVINKKLSHAYIFTGSRGVGKTTTAKIFAKILNCESPKDGEPCCVCKMCKGIDNGSILDVLEIDAASNTGVDNIRALKEDVSFVPAIGKYRVYIIDEVHMLSNGAFNALLKIMEEPPSYVVFILATTQIYKIPSTILSRCQRFDFLRHTSQVIKEHLMYVAKIEKISITAEAALCIAILAEGGLRDALSLLDTCSSASGDKIIDEKLVNEIAAVPLNTVCLEFINAIEGKNIETCLKIINDLYIKAIDITRIFEIILKVYRDILVFKLCKTNFCFFEVLQKDLEKIQNLASKMTENTMLFNISILQNAYEKALKSSRPKMELEFCAIRLCMNVLDEQNHEKKCKKNFACEKQLPAELIVAEEIGSEVKCWEEVLKFLNMSDPELSETLVDSKAYIQNDMFLIDAGDDFLNLIRNNEQTKTALKEAIFKQFNKKYRIGPYKRKELSSSKDE